MSDFNKSKVLTLFKVLLKYTDEEHPCSMKEILNLMGDEGEKCSEDSIIRYIKQLQAVLGVDVISGRGRNAKYYIGEHLLAKEELKLIVDSINASNFIEKNIASKMIEKLKETTSIYEAAELDRTVFGISVAKAENKKILYNVNKIQEAIGKGVQISFEYLVWDTKKNLVKKKEERYLMNPWALIWANDRYYLYGYTLGEKKERHFRVDKMADIELLDSPREGESQFRRFDANTYVSRRFGMFSGEERLLKVRIPEYLLGAFIDQFGKDIMVSEEGEGKLVLTFYAVPSKLLLGWFLGLEQVEILQPESAVNDMVELIENNKMFYEKRN